MLDELGCCALERVLQAFEFVLQQVFQTSTPGAVFGIAATGTGPRGLRAAAIGLVAAFSAATFAQPVFKVTAIPDESPTELARKAAPLVKYLEKTLGMKVEFTPVTDYAASVEALANKQVDMAWYGGFTFV